MQRFGVMGAAPRSRARRTGAATSYVHANHMRAVRNLPTPGAVGTQEGYPFARHPRARMAESLVAGGRPLALVHSHRGALAADLQRLAFARAFPPGGGDERGGNARRLVAPDRSQLNDQTRYRSRSWLVVHRRRTA
jgi:hypothetical protein